VVYFTRHFTHAPLLRGGGLYSCRVGREIFLFVEMATQNRSIIGNGHLLQLVNEFIHARLVVLSCSFCFWGGFRGGVRQISE